MANDQVVPDQIVTIGLMALQDEEFFVALVANPAEAIAEMQQRGRLLDVNQPGVAYMVRLMEDERRTGTRMDSKSLREMWKDFRATSKWLAEWCMIWAPPDIRRGPPAPPPA